MLQIQFMRPQYVNEQSKEEGFEERLKTGIPEGGTGVHCILNKKVEMSP